LEEAVEVKIEVDRLVFWKLELALVLLPAVFGLSLSTDRNCFSDV